MEEYNFEPVAMAKSIVKAVVKLKINESEVDEKIDGFYKSFFENKRTIKGDFDSKKKQLEKFRQRPDLMFTIFANEYEFLIRKRNKNMYYTVHLEPVMQQKALFAAEKMCADSNNLQPNWLRLGKNAEMADIYLFNAWLHFWGFEDKIKLNDKNLVYGGDGGDFYFGSRTFDSKFRDDKPSSGLILEKSFINNRQQENETIFVFNTNAHNVKNGHKYIAAMDDIKMHMPIAIVGQITLSDYKDRKENFGSKWVVDEINPINDLLLDVIEEKIESEELFSQ